MGLPSWNKNWSAMTGLMLPAAYTTRSARNIRVGLYGCLMGTAHVSQLAAVGRKRLL